MVDPRNRDDLVGAGAAFGLAALILGAMFLAANASETGAAGLAVMSGAVLVGAIAARFYFLA